MKKLTLLEALGKHKIVSTILLYGLFIFCLSSVSAINNAYYTFNNTINDLYGKYNLTVVGSVPYSIGTYGNATNWTADSSNYLYSTDMIMQSNDNVTISAIVTLKNLSSNYVIFSVGVTSAYNGIQLGYSAASGFYGYHAGVGDNIGKAVYLNQTFVPGQSYYISYAINNTDDLLILDRYTVNKTANTERLGFGNIVQGICVGGNCQPLLPPSISNAWNGLIDEIKIYNYSLNTSQIALDFGGSNIPTSSISTTLNYPYNDNTFGSVGEVFNITITPINVNITNATYFVYYQNGTLFNQTKNTVTGSSTNTTSRYIDTFTIGNYYWNVLACGQNTTKTLCSYADNNYSFQVGATLNSLTYNPSTSETKNESFNAIFNIINGSTISLAQFVYNNVNYTISNLAYTNNTVALNFSFDVPLNSNPSANQTNSFFYRFLYTGTNQVTQISNTITQNSSYINLALCSGTNNVTALNFSIIDENSGALINSNLQATFNYWLGSGTVYKNYSYQDSSTSLSRFGFCIFPRDNFNADMDSIIDSTNYPARTYYLRSAVINNNTQYINISLLNNSASTKFYFDVKLDVSPFQNALVFIQKDYLGLGTYKTVAIRQTDTLGQFVEYLEIDKSYRFIIVKNNVVYDQIDRSATCQSAPCTISLQTSSASGSLYTAYNNTFASSVQSTMVFDPTTNIVTYSFIDTTGLAKYFRLLVTKNYYNQSGGTICDVSLFSPSGSLSCNVTNYEGDFLARGYVSRSPEKLDKFISFVKATIQNNLGLFGVFFSMAWIITLAFVGGVISRGNPVVVLYMMIVAITSSKMIFFFPFSWTVVISLDLLLLLLIWKVKT